MAIKFRLLAFNWGPDAAWTDSEPTVAELPISNLDVFRRSEIARWDGLTDTYNTVTITSTIAGGGRTVNSVWIDAHNLIAGDTVQIKIWSDAGKTTLTYDSGELPAVPVKPFEDWLINDDPWGIAFSDQLPAKTFSHQFDNATYVAMEVIITREFNSVIDIGSIFFGAAYEPVYAPEFGYKFSIIDTSIQERSLGGSMYVEPKFRYRKIEFFFAYLDEDDRAELSWQLRNVNRQGIMAISAYPENAYQLGYDNAFLGYVTNNVSTPHASYNQFTADIIMEEI